jgi:hypothetical protein
MVKYVLVTGEELQAIQRLPMGAPPLEICLSRPLANMRCCHAQVVWSVVWERASRRPASACC